MASQDLVASRQLESADTPAVKAAWHGQPKLREAGQPFPLEQVTDKLPSPATCVLPILLFHHDY